MRRIIILILLITSPPCAAVEQVQVLGLFSGKASLLVDGKRYTLSNGESTPEGILLIEADSDRAVIEINSKRRVLKLGTQISSHYPEAKARVVDIYPDHNGMYLVDGAIHGAPVSFLVDTGATTIAMSSEQAKRLAIEYRRKGQAGFAETASEKVPVYLVKLDEVKVGPIRLYSVDAVVIVGGKSNQILLGQSFLNQLKMKREGALLRLEQSH